MNPFRTGRNSRSGLGTSGQKSKQLHSRFKKFRVNKRVKLRESVGVIKVKNSLKTSLLNVDGYTEASFIDVRETISKTDPDICYILETKRRLEEQGSDISIAGYDVSEARRSDLAGDKNGGGIAVYTKVIDGLVFNDYKPAIDNPAHNFVNNERVWVTVDSLQTKTAVCGLYLGFQASDDRHGDWNDSIFEVLASEISVLRAKGYRIKILGDFNAHVGAIEGQGVVGNKSDINANGWRFLRFLRLSNCVHVNGISRVTKGLWTRQRAGISSVIDYGVISVDHIHTVRSLWIDDRGVYPSGSDHNWIFLELEDRFVRKKRRVSQPSKKQTWDFRDDFDWSDFTSEVSTLVRNVDCDVLDSDSLALQAAQILLGAGKKHVGFRSPKKSASMASTSLPPELVATIELQRVFESHWKCKLTDLSNIPAVQRSADCVAAVEEAESVYIQQKQLVSALMAERSNSARDRILQDCQGPSVRAVKCFWSHVSHKTKSSAGIDAVILPDGSLTCDPEEIKCAVEQHLVQVYRGSLSPIQHQPASVCVGHEHSYSKPCVGTGSRQVPMDHCYSRAPDPCLPSSDSSCTIDADPSGWIDRDFLVSEVRYAVRKLENGKAKGIDLIPNEFIKNAGDDFMVLLTALFTKIKRSGKFPPGWNMGRVSLIHKRGRREILGNYRPLTVIVSMSGLYSRVLNIRLTQVVERHGLLGEIQNGFRKGRRGADNTFILDTILWKAKAMKQKVHMAFVDVTKAYDSVDRDILWAKLEALGFGGQFLQSLKSIYRDDCVVTSVNGLETRPVFLRRGLRQGCSLSPMLFALYIMDIGNDVALSSEGFMVGTVRVSGLLFADDLFLVARDRGGLLRLLTLVKSHADGLLLDINTEKDKSEVVSQCGAAGDLWEVMNAAGDVILSLRQVMEYKYLGTQVQSTMYRTGSAKQKLCLDKAYKYKASCIYLSRDGPDVVDMIMATWCNIAIPSILSGCEAIPFSDTTIDEIDRVQSQVAKYALGLPVGAANVCSQVDLGMKSFRHVLFEHQLKFYIRTMGLSDGRWVKQALLDHLSCSWESPYVNYMFKLRTELGLYEVPLSVNCLVITLSDYFLKKLNLRLSRLSLPWLQPVKKLRRLAYTREGLSSETIAKFRYDCAGIGNRFPRVNRIFRQTSCPLCPVMVSNTVSHLALYCPSIEKLRKEQTVMTFFRNLCRTKGFSEDYIFELLINGYDWNENPSTLKDFLSRGSDLRILLDAWLLRW